MTNQNKDYSWQWLDKLLDEFGLKYEWPYDYMHDRDRSPADQQKEARAELRAETLATIQSRIDEHYIGKGEAAKEEKAHENTIEQRDNAEEWADRLAYAKYDIQQIGEHFSANNPWANAVELLESESKRIAETHYSADGRGWIHADDFDRVMSANESEVGQRCIEARIDELSHVDGLPTCFIERNGMIVHLPIDKRLGELREQLSTNNKDTPERSSNEPKTI